MAFLMSRKGIKALKLLSSYLLISCQKMDKYRCNLCGYIYDPEKGDPDNGVEPGTAFEDVPDDWVCPVCGAGKDSFSKE